MFKTTTDAELAGNPIDEVIGSTIRYAALTSAAKLGIFRTLEEDGPKTLDELAAAIGASTDGTRAVADVAAVLGWLTLETGATATARSPNAGWARTPSTTSPRRCCGRTNSPT